MGSHWVLFLLYLNVVLSWPEYGPSRPKLVAKYNLIVIIASCLDVCCVLTVHNILYKFIDIYIYILVVSGGGKFRYFCCPSKHNLRVLKNWQFLCMGYRFKEFKNGVRFARVEIHVSKLHWNAVPFVLSVKLVLTLYLLNSININRSRSHTAWHFSNHNCEWHVFCACSCEKSD